MSRGAILLTGATGFLGMEVLARLLEHDDRDVIAPVRAPDTAAAEARIDGVLRTLWRDPSPYRGRVRAVPADLTRPGLGLSSAARAALAERTGTVLHCAASIAFDLPIDEARAINVDGTRRVIEIAREAGTLQRFVHVSTAYVAGRTRGSFGEDDLDAGQTFRNSYEETKHEAEHIVAQADDLAPAIARPSIVMGASTTGWTPAFNVLYWPVRAFARGLFDAMPARPDGRVDVVPVDYVADALVHLIDSREGGVFNLVSGRDAVTADELADLACAYFDRPRPPFVPPGAGAGSAAADEHGSVYFPYFDMDVVYDDARARAVLGPAGIRCPRLTEYFGTLMDYAEQTRWGKRPLIREDAVAASTPATGPVAALEEA
jgi:thioester reductase-like protein